MIFKEIKEINRTVGGDFTHEQAEALKRYGWQLVQCGKGEGFAEKDQSYSNGDVVFMKFTGSVQDVLATGDFDFDLKTAPCDDFFPDLSDILSLQGSDEWQQDIQKISASTQLSHV